MRAKIGNLDGRATVFALGSDYMLTRNWGLGLSYMYTKVNADLTSSGFNGSIDWGSNAVLAYATMKF
jgi:outer membrane protein W